jgi:uncharacterized protein
MRFAGYAAVFDSPDRGGDVVRAGAFARALKPGLPIYWQHDARQRIGTVESLSEDKRGLRVIASLGENAPPVKAGQGLSFGYKVRRMDQRFSTCVSRFANALNFRGEPHLPGNDLLTRYAS